MARHGWVALQRAARSGTPVRGFRTDMAVLLGVRTGEDSEVSSLTSARSAVRGARSPTEGGPSTTVRSPADRRGWTP